MRNPAKVCLLAVQRGSILIQHALSPARHSAHKRIAKCARNASATRAVRLRMGKSVILRRTDNEMAHVQPRACVLQTLATKRIVMICVTFLALDARRMANASVESTPMGLTIPCCFVYVQGCFE